MKSFRFGIITVSDSCFKNHNNDKSGMKLVELLDKQFEHCKIELLTIVPDDVSLIKNALLECCEKKLDVAFTIGGTGFAPRDVTPEATRQVITKEAPGLITAMLLEGMQKNLYVILSRAICGIRDETLIINLSGSVNAVTEQFYAIKSVIPHAIALIHDDIQDVRATHESLQGIPKKDFVPSKVKVDAVASRNRSSPYEMISVEKAHEIIQSVCLQTSDIIEVDIRNAISRVLAEDVVSFDALPPFPSSIKDGYAVIASDGVGPRTVVDGIAAGDAPMNMELKPGQCVRISTGGPVPPGADAVVQVEDTELLSASEDNSKELEINILKEPKSGQEIRKIGSDIPAHCVILKKNTVLNSAEIGVLAAIGKTNVKVYKRPKIAIISTGNELKDPRESLGPGQIRDSNKITLLTLLEQYEYDSEDFGIVKDNPDSVKRILEEAFDKFDFIITTGGVSMGEYDVIKRVLEEDFQANIHFGRVNMKPGKPTTFATCNYNGKIKIIFGLPGNPVSATVTCLLFVIPTLKHCENNPNILPPKVEVEPKFTVELDDERPEYQRVNLKFLGNAIEAYSTGNQISSKLNSFVGANGLLILPAKNKLNSDIAKHYSSYPVDCYLIHKFV